MARALHPVARRVRMRTSPHTACGGDVMAPRVLTCAPDTPLVEVATIMAEQRVHCVVVYEGERPGEEGWTVVSDRDLMAAAAADRIDEPLAGEVAGTSVPSIGSGEPLTRAAQVMSEHDVSHLIVLGAANGRPEGVLSSLDVAMVLAAPRS